MNYQELKDKPGPAQAWREMVNQNARPGDVANLICERDELRKALSDAISWMQGRAPESVCNRYQGLLDGTFKPWHERIDHE